MTHRTDRYGGMVFPGKPYHEQVADWLDDHVVKAVFLLTMVLIMLIGKVLFA